MAITVSVLKKIISLTSGISTSSDNTVIRDNFVNLMIGTASYQDRLEPFNFRWEANIEASNSRNLVLQGNLVSGSERTGYLVPPLPCGDMSGRYQNNKAFANLLGISILPEHKVNEECAMFANFTIWKSHDFGMYYQQGNSEFVAQDNVFIENKNGLFVILFGPSSSSHGFANKEIEVNDNLFVGQTTSFDCSIDVTPRNDTNFALSSVARPVAAPGGGMVGLVFGQFYSSSNKAPQKPLKGIMAYQAIGGLTKARGNTFAKYGNVGCTNKGNFAITTSSGNDDGQHPVEISQTTLVDVAHENIVAYHRPNVG